MTSNRAARMLVESWTLSTAHRAWHDTFHLLGPLSPVEIDKQEAMRSTIETLFAEGARILREAERRTQST